jgi:hypothetical protein
MSRIPEDGCMDDESKPGSGLDGGDEGPVVSFGGVSFAPDGVRRLDGNARFVPREEIRHLSLHQGILSENPILPAFLGAVLLFLGFGPSYAFAAFLLNDGPADGCMLFGAPLFPIGLYVIWDAFRTGDYLLIESELYGREKVRLRVRGDEEGLYRFFQAVTEDLGYEIDDASNRSWLHF